MKRRVYIAYTGGTIGMKHFGRHYLPVSNFLQEEMAAILAFSHDSLPAYTINEYEPLLDSHNMTPADWSHIARDIYDHYEEYDGFIVLHGTDTMACVGPGFYVSWPPKTDYRHRLPNSAM